MAKKMKGQVAPAPEREATIGQRVFLRRLTGVVNTGVPMTYAQAEAQIASLMLAQGQSALMRGRTWRTEYEREAMALYEWAKKNAPETRCEIVGRAWVFTPVASVSGFPTRKR